MAYLFVPLDIFPVFRLAVPQFNNSCRIPDCNTERGNIMRYNTACPNNRMLSNLDPAKTQAFWPIHTPWRITVSLTISFCDE